MAEKLMGRPPFAVSTSQLLHSQPGKAVQSPRSITPPPELRGIPSQAHAVKNGPLLGVQFTLKADYRRFKNGIGIGAGGSKRVQNEDTSTGNALKDALGLALHHAQGLIHYGRVAKDLTTPNPREQENTQPKGSRASPVDEGNQLPLLP
ncbi:hypothetical protein, partial [Thermus scotoductus]|uniref:hypothetical protein n=1 Tax=Thermus scotoductus TaxID=37636 RepID=UPI001C12A157